MKYKARIVKNEIDMVYLEVEMENTLCYFEINEVGFPFCKSNKIGLSNYFFVNLTTEEEHGNS